MRFTNYSLVDGMILDSVSTDGSTYKPLNITGNPLVLQHPSFQVGGVGIATTNPSAKLHVSGTTIIESAMTTNSTLNVSGTTTIMGSTGIGVAPTAKLHVRGPTNTINFRLDDGVTELTFKTGTKYSTATPGWTTIDPNGDSSSGLAIYDNLGVHGGMAVGTTTEPGHGNMVVAGTLGLGTNSASAGLHVSGTALVTGAMTMNSSLYVSGITTLVGIATIKGFGVSSFPGITLSSDQTTNMTSLFNITGAGSGVYGSSVGDTILCNGNNVEPAGNVYIQRTTGYNPVITATANGAVGINNITPSANFHVAGTSILQGASTISSTLNVSGTSTFNNTMNLTNNTSALATYLQLTNGGATGGSQITFYNNASNFAYINFGGTSYVTPNSMNLGTYGGGMTITGGGLVGIGTTSPATKLHVYGQGPTSIAIGNQVANMGPELGLVSSPSEYSLSAVTGDSVLRSLSGKLLLQYGGGNCGLAINSNNYVGINTNNPTSFFTVVGTNATNDVSIGPYTAEFKGSGAFDGCTVLRVDNTASSFGRAQIQLVGRFEANNDEWSLLSGRNNMIFQTRVTSGSTVRTNFAIQNNRVTQFGILSSFNPTYPAFAINGSNNNVGISTESPSATLHVSGTTIINNGMTAASTLNVAGLTTIMNDVNIRTTNNNGILQISNNTTTSRYHLTLTGSEFYQPNNTSTHGIGMTAGVNRTGNKQLWIADTELAINNTNTQIRIMPNGGVIDAVSTDGIVLKELKLQGSGISINGGALTATSALNVSGTTTLAGASVNLTAIPNTTSNANFVLTYNNSTGAVGYNGYYVAQLFNNQGQSWSGGVTSGQITLGANSKLIQGTVTYYTTAVTLAQFSLIFTPVGGGTSYTFNFNKYFNHTYSHMEHTITLALSNNDLPAGTYTCQAIKSGANSANIATDANDQIMIAITNLPN
jgi:hypothetical protein